ncbi:MAG: nucleotidyltransferase domain-containing protein [Spirochaetales bacterium]|nr:nucleotidyltransferase domain-containing protein [Spirochaetales bacterium]
MDKKTVLDKLKEFKLLNASKFNLTQIGIFGSVARGESNENSDLDVVVQLEHPDIFIMVHIKEELENEMGCKVDIIRDQKHLNPFLKKQIEEEAVFV